MRFFDVHLDVDQVWHLDILVINHTERFLGRYRKKTNDKLAEKLSQELVTGTRLVSNTFTFHGWQVEAHDEEDWQGTLWTWKGSQEELTKSES